MSVKRSNQAHWSQCLQLYMYLADKNCSNSTLTLFVSIKFFVIRILFQECLLDFSNIDIILISNYHFMLALPFITEVSGLNIWYEQAGKVFLFYWSPSFFPYLARFFCSVQVLRARFMQLNQQFKLAGNNFVVCSFVVFSVSF